VDTTAWYYRSYKHQTNVDEPWQTFVYLYLEYRQKLAALAGELKDPKPGQHTLTSAIEPTGQCDTDD
jgi:hypothetical protein